MPPPVPAQRTAPNCRCRPFYTGDRVIDVCEEHYGELIRDNNPPIDLIAVAERRRRAERSILRARKVNRTARAR